MKKIFLLITIVLLLPVIIFAQNVQDAKHLIYYERYKSARQILDETLRQEPDNAEAWYWLSQIYMHDNNALELQDRLADAPKDVFNDPYFQVARGHLLLEQGNKDEADRFFQQAIKKTRSKNAGILAAAAKAHIKCDLGDASVAVEMIKKAIKRDKKNPALYVLLGDAYRKMGNGEDAYKAYHQALSKDAHFAAAFYKVGKIFLTQNNPSLYLKYFMEAVEADSKYAPALYDLYYHYYFTDAKKAMEYFNRYIANSDKDQRNEYRYADLLYLAQQYKPAIQKAQKLLLQPIADTMTRLYKLMAYSYLGLQDTSNAITSMNNYFTHEADSNLVSKDFEMMATLYRSIEGKEDSVIINYERAVATTQDTATRLSYFRELADLYKERKDYVDQAYWLGKYYENNPRTTNLDLFNWGIAYYRAEDYPKADTVFGRYIEKYPDQGFGYYWRARINALCDSSMKEGLAVPYYNQLIDVIKEKDTLTSTHKKWLVQAYSYKAAWETNEKKDYVSAIENLNKVLEIDPANKDARRYIAILEKRLPDNMATEAKN